jgi:glycosyltransferase involved in cell wall biosynthesis
MDKKILICPLFDPWYYEFYIKGLHDFYKGYTIEFSFEDRFLQFNQFVNGPYRKEFFYYEVWNNGNVQKVCIAANDKCDVNETVYEWVDVYAKVNIDEPTLQAHSKALPIGPNFGINYFSLPAYLNLSWKLYRKAGIKNPYFRVFTHQSLKRCPFDVYANRKPAKDNFVFYLNYPWKKHTTVTNLRKEIITMLQQLDRDKVISFEGGFSRRRLGPFEGLENYSAKKRYNHKAYLEQLKQSAIAINTPAVHDCLGWKLGEYLALGKAIISTPINRVLPGNFAAGTHYMEIKDVNTELKDAIAWLVGHKEQRMELEQNALAYFERYCSPAKTIAAIHTFATNKTGVVQV